MVLVDTSVWIDHFRQGQPELARLLTGAAVLTHPFIIGELACGNLKARATILTDLSALPLVKSASHDEAVRLIDDRKLWGRGIGWIDSHLLASALISNCQFWTLDKRLCQLAHDVGVTGLVEVTRRPAN
jgi:predicted nucleic acid-binding protein